MEYAIKHKVDPNLVKKLILPPVPLTPSLDISK